MTVDEHVAQIVPYFLDEQYDAITPLEPDEYAYLLRMIEQAIDEFPDDCAFWFWKGWALQFFSWQYEGYVRHPHFELIEDAYEYVLELNSERVEAHFMLAYLYWDAARRERDIIFIEIDPETSEQNQDLEIAEYEAARRHWQLFINGDGLEQVLQGSWFYLYPFEPPAWSTLLKRMLPQVATDRFRLPLLYYEWGVAWVYVQANGSVKKRQESYEQARWAFSMGANVEQGDMDFKECCQAALVEYQSARYGGDPAHGLIELRRFAEMLRTRVETGRICIGGVTSDVPNYYPDDTENFLYDHPFLVEKFETADIILSLESSGWFNLTRRGAGKLNWYLGRCYLHRREWDKADDYLSLAYREMPVESELILDLATAKDEQGKSDESVRLLCTLPGQTQRDLRIRRLAERDLARSEFLRSVERLPASIDLLIGKIDTVYGLVSNLGETLTSAIQNFRMPDVSPVGQGSLDVDELAARVAQEVGNQFAAIVAEKPALFDNIRQKCKYDLHGAWSVLPLDLQEQIVVGETMHILFSEYSIPEYGALIVQWGKITESMMRLGILMPMAGYLDKINHRSSVLLKVPTSKGKFMTKQVDVPPSGKSWSQPLPALKFSESLGLLFAARDMRDKHAVYGFLTHIGDGQSHVDLLLSQVPDHIDQIREYRNKAAHFSTHYYLTDALDVRSILFTRGLIAEMAFLLERAKSAGLAPK